MLEFCANAFKKGFSFFLWLNVIGWVITGAVVDSISPFHLLGLIAGFAFGMLSNIIFGGLVAIYFRIDDNLSLIAKRSDSKTTTPWQNSERDPLNLL